MQYGGRFEHGKHEKHENGKVKRWWAIPSLFAKKVAPVDSVLIPKRKAIQIAVVNRVHSRLSPTQPFSERLPTFEVRLSTFEIRLPT
jgi:hypothetical protein